MNTRREQFPRLDFVLSIILGAFFLVFLVPTVSYAANKSNGIEAVKMIQSAQALSLAPLEQTRIGIGFKNTSGAPWKANDSKKITLRSAAKKESYFYHYSWLTGNRVMNIPQETKNGEIVYFWFILEAPAQEGTYQEEFFLYSGDKKIGTTAAAMPITVRAAQKTAQNTVEKTPLPQQASSTPPVFVAPSATALAPAQLSAMKLITSAQSLTMKQYERTTFRIGFKNTSGTSWKAGQQPAITLRAKASKESYFYDPSWISGNIVMALSGDTQDGEIAYFEFMLFAPIFPRAYQENLSLYAGNAKIAGSDVNIPINVVQASSSVLTNSDVSQQAGAELIETTLPQSPDSAASSQPQPMLQVSQARTGIIENKTEAEPFIRVGLYHTTETVRLTANKDYEVRDSDGAVLSVEPAGALTTIAFDFSSKLYTVTTPTRTVTTPKYIRMRGQQVPYRIITHADGTIVVEPLADQDTIFELLSYTNRPAWSTTLNDNTFRGEIEARYAPATNRLWVVNELLFEQYLKGIAETSNSSPYEYQKALIVAARTYAKYHIDRNSKHAAEGFTVKPTEADQVYRGYASEKRMPNVARAVEETRGVIAYYGDTIAITPYYSQSDGRTRNWEEVWGGTPKQWLVSKPDPCCTGLPMLGHGVGMSARGALAMALDNKGFEEILKYYYTGVELRKKY